MPAILKLSREALGIELRRGTFHVLLDGKDAGIIERHDTIETSVEPGLHTIQIRAGRYSSRVRTFEVREGDVANFRCHGALIWPLYLASILVPTLAISLKVE